MDPTGKFMMCESAKIGMVNKLIILKSDSNEIHEQNLEHLAKQRVEARGNPKSMK